MSFNKKRYKPVPRMVMNSGFLTPRQICLWIEAFAHSAEGILISRKTGAPMLGWKIGTQFIKELPKCFTSCSHLTNDIDPKDGWEALDRQLMYGHCLGVKLALSRVGLTLANNDPIEELKGRTLLGIAVFSKNPHVLKAVIQGGGSFEKVGYIGEFNGKKMYGTPLTANVLNYKFNYILEYKECWPYIVDSLIVLLKNQSIKYYVPKIIQVLLGLDGNQDLKNYVRSQLRGAKGDECFRALFDAAEYTARNDTLTFEIIYCLIQGGVRYKGKDGVYHVLKAVRANACNIAKELLKYMIKSNFTKKMTVAMRQEMAKEIVKPILEQCEESEEVIINELHSQVLRELQIDRVPIKRRRRWLFTV